MDRLFQRWKECEVSTGQVYHLMDAAAAGLACIAFHNSVTVFFTDTSHLHTTKPGKLQGRHSLILDGTIKLRIYQ